ncbi:MAG: hypothetical protein HYW47_03570 [Deltaproteobacteria bacterium]|nr:hypothetical protein [Deltaproteobacteria bacterium]
MNLSKNIEKIGKELLSQPTAPYREYFVQKYIKSFCNKNKIDFCFDKWGNIWIGTKSTTFSKNEDKIVFVAHMDHPGFHITKKLKNQTWEAKWFGGGPVKKLKGAPVYLTNENGNLFKGKIINFKLHKSGKKVETLHIQSSSTENLKNYFGSYNYPGYQKKKDLIYTKSADDLGGVLMVLSVAKLLKNKPSKKSFLGLLTRAEEVGFQGCLGSIYAHTIPKKFHFISVETSNYKAGVQFGKGPVIRLGDRASVFDTHITYFIRLVAAELQKKNKKFCYQTRMMDGGACEATAFNVHKLPSGGLCVPLGGYHNESESGVPCPEFVNIRDLKNLILLSEALVQKYSQKEKYLKKVQRSFLKSFSQSKKLLQKYNTYLSLKI